MLSSSWTLKQVHSELFLFFITPLDIKHLDAIPETLFHLLCSGSLAQFLKARGPFPEDLALYYHCQVLQALEHLHGRKVIHLDVKGERSPHDITMTEF